MKKTVLRLKHETLRTLTTRELRSIDGAALENVSSVPPVVCDSKTTCPFTNRA